MSQTISRAPQIVANAKQALVIACPCNEILYGGAAGASKTYCIILDWIAHHERYGGKAKGLVLRRTLPELKDLMREADGIFATMPNKPRWKENDKTYEYADGASLEMGYLDSYADVNRYIGRAFNWRGNDELTQWATPDEYEMLNTRMRSVDGVPVRIISATNPGSAGHSWVMNRWQIDRYPNGMKPIITETKLPDGKIIKWSKIFIPGRLEDNRPLDDSGEYRASLMEKPEHIRKMLLEGRWDVVEGTFFTEWNPDVHVVKTFTPPKSWKRWMGADWGSASPYSFGWYTKAPDGVIYRYRELYGDGGKPNVGTRESADEVAKRIRAIENEYNEYITERYLDASCFDLNGHELSIAGIFAHNGIHFSPSVKHHKAASIENFRSFLRVVNGTSMFKVMDCCHHFIRTAPRLQINRDKPDQYDTDGEDHCLDDAIYAMRKYMTDPSNKRLEDPYASQLAKYRRYGKRGIM